MASNKLSYTAQLSPLGVRAVGLEDQELFHLIVKLSHVFLPRLSGFMIATTCNYLGIREKRAGPFCMNITDPILLFQSQFRGP